MPRPPFVSAGRLGHEQLDALARILALPEVARRTPVVLVHHDPIDSWSGLEQRRSGLHDAAELRAALGRVPRALVLFGHLHVRRRSALRTATGEVDVVCATGAALDHPSDAVRAGYNVYEIDRDGAIVSVEACVLDEPGRPLRRIALARE